MRINKKQFKKWIKALRSAKYKQNKAALQVGDGFCCLGVACDVLIKEQLKKRNSTGSLSGAFPKDQPNAPRWLKVINDDFAKKQYLSTYSLIDKRTISYLNDSENMTFDEIADCLEAVYVHKAMG